MTPFTDDHLKRLKAQKKLYGIKTTTAWIKPEELEALLARLEAAEEAMDEFKAHKKFDCMECCLADEAWRKAAGK